MRTFLASLISIPLLYAPVAMAENQPINPMPYQESSNNVHPPKPVFMTSQNYPPVYYTTAPVPVLVDKKPQEGDYGFSVISDLRQLNF